MASTRARRALLVPSLALAAIGALLTPAHSGADRVPPGLAAERTGVLVENHGDHLDHGDGHEPRAEPGWSLRLGDGTAVALDRVPDAAHGLVGRTVRARGVERSGRLDVGAGGTVAAADGSGASTGTGTTAAAVAPGVKTVAVLLVNFTDDPSQPWTAAQARSVVFDGTTSVNAFYQDSSDGQVSLTGDVFGYVTVTKDNVGCDWSAWAADARAAAIAAGYPLANYTYTVYAWPRTTLCGWAGLGYLPGTTSYVDGNLTTRVVGHELGHNFGVHHASSMSCTAADGSPVTVGGTCTSSEYGDPFTVMGSAARLHSNWQRAQLGWLTGVTTATTTSSYLLVPADSTAGVRLVRVPRGDGTYLNLEFRQPTGVFDTFGAADAVVNGVTIRVAPDLGTIVQSQLVDATPTSPSSFTDSSLKAGRTFTDPLSGVTVAVTSVSAAGAQVTVSYGPDATPPSAVAGLTATAAATATASSAALRWQAATDDRGVAGYTVRRDGAALGTTASTSFTDAGLVPGTAYTYTVEAFDAAGNVGPATSVRVVAVAVDTGRPTTPTNLRATVGRSRSVALAWTASTDPEGSAVTYTVTRTGKRWTTTATSTSDKPGRGTVTYTIVATDAAGNASDPATVSVVVA